MLTRTDDAPTEDATTADREHAAIAGVVRRLQERFRTTDPAHVSEIVHGHRRHYDGAHVRRFVPVLVEHASRDSLDGRSGPAGPARPGG